MKNVFFRLYVKFAQCMRKKKNQRLKLNRKRNLSDVLFYEYRGNSFIVFIQCRCIVAISRPVHSLFTQQRHFHVMWVLKVMCALTDNLKIQSTLPLPYQLPTRESAQSLSTFAYCLLERVHTCTLNNFHKWWPSLRNVCINIRQCNRYHTIHVKEVHTSGCSSVFLLIPPPS